MTVELPELDKALADYSYDLIDSREISKSIFDKYDKIILSGGHIFNVLHPNLTFQNEAKIIKGFKKPLLGICLGFQLICIIYGAGIEQLKEYEYGMLKINKIQEDIVLQGIPDSFYVFENHHNSVKSVGKNLIPLAVSKQGIEIVRHASKPIWGTQFHPEHFGKKSIGRKLINNFIDFSN
ncbi:gamma-glutamyl-gamma-aminobutyrate hydrolase family protein [Candidatus Marsarchaeota archaeon]|nr:gamma-glutamyl-gamma-aminobutyrate hydrolase family protein [Candidatus Marsarchaeota archaeon]